MKKIVIVIVLAFFGLYVLSCTHDREETELYEYGIDNGDVQEDDI